MKTIESDEEIEIESRFGRAARLTFLGSLGFWPLFLFAAKFMLDAPGKAHAMNRSHRRLPTESRSMSSSLLRPLRIGPGVDRCRLGVICATRRCWSSRQAATRSVIPGAVAPTFPHLPRSGCSRVACSCREPRCPPEEGNEAV